MSTVIPQRVNRSETIIDEVVVTDRDGNEIDDISWAVTEPPNPDWDIDRAGSKGRTDIAARYGVLEPGMWIAPYRTIVPEVGDIIRWPRGHFKLGRPSETYDGTYATGTGSPATHQSASGSDIIDSIAAVKLTEPFYTGRKTHVMSEVYTLIKMATAGVLGPNLVPNHSFEDSGTGWSQAWGDGGAGSQVWTVPTNWDTPDGVRAIRAIFNNTTTPNGYHIATSNMITIPAGAQFLCLHGFSYSSGGMSMYMQIRFYDEDNNSLGSDPIIRTRPSSATTNDYATDAWSRQFGAGPVPDDAAKIQLWLWSRDRIGGREVSAAWDDVQVRTCTQMPLPDDRINLPHSTALTTTRIQTMPGKSIGYDAINADRLSAIGHFALFTDLTGRPMSAPLRTLETAVPKRTYGPGDARITSPVEIPQVSGLIPNRFSAIKESFEEGVEPIYVTSENNNPDDPYSIPRSGEVVDAETIFVQDAVSEAALQAVADAARDRYSTQEEVMFRTTPDMDLTVYDVIEINDPAMPKASGKWSIQYIGGDGPEMVIAARRAIGGG